MMSSLKKEEANWLLLTKRQGNSKWSVVVNMFCDFLVCSCECIVIWYQSYMSLSLYILSTYLGRQTVLVLIGDMLTHWVIARRSNLCSMWNSSNLGPQVVNFNSWKLWISWHLCLPTRKCHIKFLCVIVDPISIELLYVQPIWHESLAPSMFVETLSLSDKAKMSKQGCHSSGYYACHTSTRTYTDGTLQMDPQMRSLHIFCSVSLFMFAEHILLYKECAYFHDSAWSSVSMHSQSVMDSLGWQSGLLSISINNLFSFFANVSK